VATMVAADVAGRRLQIQPAELARRVEAGDQVNLLDIRTREEFEEVKIDGAQFFTQELMQEATNRWPKEALLVIYDHKGDRALDAAAWFQGHGFDNVKVLRGGIDAWSMEVDPELPRYHLETA